MRGASASPQPALTGAALRFVYQVTLNFHYGALLADPEGVFRQGTSRFMRMLDYPAPAAVEAGLIARCITEAVSDPQSPNR